MVEFLHGLKGGFREFAELMADAVNLVLLFVVYFLGVGITSLVARVFGKRFLDWPLEKKSSYWIAPVDETWEKRGSFYRIF